MKTTLIGATVIAALSLYGLPAHASCADPRGGTQEFFNLILKHQAFGPHEGIVGTWLATYPNGQAYIQWHSDGTEWENINLPPTSGNLCMGSWEAKGPWTYYRNHYGWLFDPTGTNIGYFNETETDVLAHDGNSYSGTNTTYFYLPDGTMAGVGALGGGFPPANPLPGTSSAVRISP
jgi:hypothetical protein